MIPSTPQHKASKCDRRACPNCARSKARTFALGTVPILSAYPCKEIKPPDEVTYLLLDASNRPDLQDLVRVIWEVPEDEWEVIYSWEYLIMPEAQAYFARLDVQVTRPVRTSYKILFDLDKHYELLLGLYHTGNLAYGFAPSNSLGTFMRGNMHGLDELCDRMRDAAELKSRAEVD